MHLDVPGVDPNTIDVSVEQNTLTVIGERVRPRAEGDEVVLLVGSGESGVRECLVVPGSGP